jgi:antitoxin (DNA-binding transcriptional repressor) of toxin-antitoxin stability system
MTVKRIEIGQATGPLGQYAREIEAGPVVLTQDGHAVAALVPIDDEDAESLALSLSPRFQAVIEQARAEFREGQSLTADEVRRSLGVSPKAE